MRLARLVTTLVLALALVAGSLAPASMASAAGGSAVHEGHSGPTRATVADEHRHDAPMPEAPAHTADCCQAACCIGSGQPAARAGDATAIRFFSSVRYADYAKPRRDRAVPPEPGVPKTFA